MNKYEIRTQHKKNEIIKAALDQFNNNGFSASSIKDIAKQAHVSQVSIYNYFGSKDALVGECAKIIMESTLEKARDILHQELPFREQLISALNLCSNQTQISLTRYLSNAALSDPCLLKLLGESINLLKLDLFKEYIEAGKNAKEIDPSISTEIYLKFIDAINGFDFSSQNIEAEQNAVHKLFLYGMIGK